MEAVVLGGEDVVPVKVFQKELLKFSDEQIENIASDMDRMLEIDLIDEGNLGIE